MNFQNKQFKNPVKLKIKKRPTTHYVNNSDLYKALIVYRKQVNACKRTKTQAPRVPEYIGECIMKISTHLAHRPNFINYTFVDEMIADGIENCLTYIHNFDPKKSKNPFAYFTQIIYFAFVRRIQKEKKNLYIKLAATQYANILGETAEVQDNDTSKSYDTTVKYGEWPKEQMEKFISDFEVSQKIKKEKQMGRYK